MKKTVSRFSFWLVLSVLALTNGGAAPSAFAQSSELGPVRPPSIFNEGTGGRLTPDQIRELLPWSFDSKTELKELLARLPQLPPRQQQEALETELRRIVARSEGSRAALLMRYVINRGLLLSGEIARETQGQFPWVLDQQVRLLRASAELAVKYADSDAQFLKEGKVPPAYGAFGIEYAGFLVGLTQSVLDTSAQYRVMRLALGLLAWDLYQDERRLEYASAILRLQQSLERNPEQPSESERDSALLVRMRDLRDAYQRALSPLGIHLDGVCGRSRSGSPICAGAELWFWKENAYNPKTFSYFRDFVSQVDPQNNLVKFQRGDEVPGWALAAEVDCANGLCREDEVYLSEEGYSEEWGTLRKVFEDGTAFMTPRKRPSVTLLVRRGEGKKRGRTKVRSVK